jgi:hypothetical protein
MNSEIKNLFNEIGIPFEEIQALNGLCVPREVFLNNETYTSIKEKIPSLKHYFSSSMLTSLQKNAAIKQKWPLLNLIRQILKSLYYKMTPIRLSDGYTKEGKKKYRRLFSIEQLQKIDQNNNQT